MNFPDYAKAIIQIKKESGGRIMCGIVGYYGHKKAKEVIIKGLSNLEYRGYDSAGIAVISEEGNLQVAKKKGRLQMLEDFLAEKTVSGGIGVGHTRWATHGAPSDVNSHPHTNADGTLAVVHNGIIENYLELKQELQALGYHFQSETDTEVVAHLIDYYDNGDFLESVYQTLERLEGAYALGVVSQKYPGELIAARKESPLIVGCGTDEFYIASDVPAILEYTRDVYYIDNNEVVHIKENALTIYDGNKQVVQKELKHIDWDVEAASKNGFDHFMLKEIYDQPTAIRETLLRRINKQGKIQFDDILLNKETLAGIQQIYIVACGTAYHAGLVGKYAIEKLAKIPVQTDIASEFRYSDPFIDEHSLLIVVSQSGETADTLAAMKEAKRKGARVMAITNVVGSSVAREADDVLYTWAGPEISVASTKAYTAQLVAFYMLALYLADLKGVITESQYTTMIKGIEQTAETVEQVLEEKEHLKMLAEKICHKHSAFYLGRGVDYTTAMEASLKLKEISYIHTEAFAAGELKHGTIALVEEGTPIIALMTQQALEEKMRSNVKEVKARGAYVIAFARQSNTQIVNEVDEVIWVQDLDDLLMPIVSVVPAQLLSYYTSLAKGNDVDKPRNLAKSVTVE